MPLDNLPADDARNKFVGKSARRTMRVGAIDAAARTVELAFSSEAEVERWYGIEILDHDPVSVDMTRMLASAPAIMDHDWTDQIGVVVSAEIRDDRRGAAKIRFSRSARASDVFQDIVDEIRTHVSVGYIITDAVLQETRDGVSVYRVTGWQPYEISFVSVPADIDVGVGRSAEIPAVEEVSEPSDTAPVNSDHPARDTRMPDNLPPANPVAERQAGVDAERARTRALTDLGTAYGATDMALQYITEGKTAEDMQRALLHRYAKDQSNTPLTEQSGRADIGLSEKEVRRFSIFKAVRALASPNDNSLRQAAAFEFECSEAAQKQYGKESRGMLIPSDVLNNRAFSTTTPAGGPGSAVVATELLAGSFIELLRHKAWLLKRATTMGGLVGNVEIPRQNAGNQAYWVGEGAAPTEGEPGTDQVAFSPKQLAAYTDITRRLLKQSTPDAEQIVRNDLIKVMALAVDYAGLYGTGSANAQPTGLKSIAGINTMTLAGAMPTYDEYVEMETALATGDADVGAMAYVINPKARGAAKTTLKFPAAAIAQGGTIWEPGATINGYETSVTNQVAATDTFFGNWEDFVVAMWGGLDLMVDPYSLSTSGGIRIVTFQDVDMNVRHVQSFMAATAAAAS